jgi:hypothetical protein
MWVARKGREGGEGSARQGGESGGKDGRGTHERRDIQMKGMGMGVREGGGGKGRRGFKVEGTLWEEVCTREEGERELHGASECANLGGRAAMQCHPTRRTSWCAERRDGWEVGPPFRPRG